MRLRTIKNFTLYFSTPSAKVLPSSTCIITQLSPNNPYPALDSPLTEFAVWKMNVEVERAKFVDNFLLFVENGIRQLPIQIGGWGASVEDDRQLTVVAGWENLEVRELFGTIKESLFIILTLDIRNSIMLS